MLNDLMLNDLMRLFVVIHCKWCHYAVNMNMARKSLLKQDKSNKVTQT
jgi:hypothetical protein